MSDKIVATTKTDFIKSFKENLSVELSTDQAKEAYDLFLQIIKDSISSEEKLNLNGLGTFKVSHRAARRGRNPRTGEEMDISASKSVGFKPAPSFKESL